MFDEESVGVGGPYMVAQKGLFSCPGEKAVLIGLLGLHLGILKTNPSCWLDECWSFPFLQMNIGVSCPVSSLNMAAGMVFMWICQAGKHPLKQNVNSSQFYVAIP